MMDGVVGRIVQSSSGRDKGTYMLCVDRNESFLLVCDGRCRPLERPKRKNPRHLIITDDRLPPEDVQTNRALRRSLRQYAQMHGRDA